MFSPLRGGASRILGALPWGFHGDSRALPRRFHASGNASGVIPERFPSSSTRLGTLPERCRVCGSASAGLPSCFRIASARLPRCFHTASTRRNTPKSIVGFTQSSRDPSRQTYFPEVPRHDHFAAPLKDSPSRTILLHCLRNCVPVLARFRRSTRSSTRRLPR